jgi:hypothetical protein
MNKEKPRRRKVALIEPAEYEFTLSEGIGVAGDRDYDLQGQA